MKRFDKRIGYARIKKEGLLLLTLLYSQSILHTKNGHASVPAWPFESLLLNNLIQTREPKLKK